MTIFEAAATPFQGVLGETVGAMLATFYADQGVRLLTDVPIRGITAYARGVHITAGDGRVWNRGGCTL